MTEQEIEAFRITARANITKVAKNLASGVGLDVLEMAVEFAQTNASGARESQMRIVGDTALFTVEDPEPLLAAMPWAKYLNFKGQHVLGIPHDFLHMQAARGCG